MTKSFFVTIQMADELFGPDAVLTKKTQIFVPNGTTYADAYAALEHEVKIMCASVLRTELEERERRGELVDTVRLRHDAEYRAGVERRVRNDPHVPQWEERRRR